MSSKTTEHGCIDWPTEIEKTRQLFAHCNELGVDEYEKHLPDLYAPGFVRISQRSIIEGDFKAMRKLREERKKRTIKPGPSNIVSVRGNTALVWFKISFTDDCEPGESVYTVLLEYHDDKARVKMVHVSPFTSD